MEIYNIDATLFWFILGVTFLVLEVLTPGFFLIFFGFGAWVTGGLVFLWPFDASVQWAVFMMVSVASLIILRRKLKGLLQKERPRGSAMDDPVFADKFLGRPVVVLKEVKPGAPGLVELNGTNWQAQTKGKPIAVGQRAVVLAIEGLTLLVEISDNE